MTLDDWTPVRALIMDKINAEWKRLRTHTNPVMRWLHERGLCGERNPSYTQARGVDEMLKLVLQFDTLTGFGFKR